MLRTLRRLDVGWAKGEAAIAAVVLLVLIVVAATQALLRNLTLWDVQWANDVLEGLSWSDSFMQKATLWLAFLGASLAVQGRKHIGIDIVPRIAPERIGAILGGLVWIAAALTCFFLAGVFFESILNNAADLPFDYQAMTETGESIHRCDASAALLERSELPKPGLFCALRGALGFFGAPISTPDTALQLIVPVMLFVMTLRFFGYGGLALLRGFGVMGLEPARVAAERERISVEIPAADPPTSETDEKER